MCALKHQAAAGQSSANHKPDGTQKVSVASYEQRSARSNAVTMLASITFSGKSIPAVGANLIYIFPIILFGGLACSCVSAQKFRAAQEEAKTLRAQNAELKEYTGILLSQNQTLLYSNVRLKDEFSSYRTDCENLREARSYSGGALGLQEHFKNAGQPFDVLSIGKIWDQYSAVAFHKNGTGTDSHQDIIHPNAVMLKQVSPGTVNTREIDMSLKSKMFEVR
jgi:hypothetical protein